LKKFIGEIMTEMGFLREEELQHALRKQSEAYRGAQELPERLARDRLVARARQEMEKKPLLGKVLTDMGFCTGKQIQEALQKQESMARIYGTLSSEKLGTAIEIGSIVNSTLNLAEVLSLIMKHANKVTHSMASTLMLVDEETDELVFSVPTGPNAERLTDVRMPSGKGIAGWVAETGVPLCVPNVKEDPRFYGRIDEMTGFDTRSLLCVPLKAKSKLIGVLEVINKQDGSSFDEQDVLLLSIFAYQAAIAIENARLYGELQNRLEEERRLQRRFADIDKFQALGQMASGVAHDFNNMLAVILGNAELIEMEEDKEMILRKVNLIKRAALDSANTIKRLLKFARSKKSDTDYELIDMNDIVKEAIEITAPRWKDQAQERGIHIRVVEKPAVEKLEIVGSGSDLREMIVNFIFNAVDAMPEGGRLELGTWAENDHACLRISDTGTGMTEDTKNRIFDPFYTTKGVTHTGLGMSMVYGIIKRHNGKIEMESTAGKGTTFLIRLPRGFERAPGETPQDAGSSVLKDAKILIIDDEVEIGRILGSIFSHQGNHAEVYNNSRAGIEAFGKDNYDVVITDLGMPDMSGWEVAAIIRRMRPQVLIGMVTGWDISDMEAKQKGVDFVITKPFQVERIADTVAKAMRSARGGESAGVGG